MRYVKPFLFAPLLALAVSGCPGGSTVDPIEGCVDGRQTLPAEIASDLTLTEDCIYVVAGQVEVLDGATLTLEAGTRVEVDPGQNPLIVSGELIVDGTAEAPVVYTSAAALPAPGDHHGIVIEGSGTATLRHLELSYAGGPSIFADTDGPGLLILGEGVTVEDSVFAHNARYGVWVAPSEEGAESRAALASFARNRFVSNPDGGVRIEAEHADELGSGHCFTDSDDPAECPAPADPNVASVYLEGGTIEEQVTWPALGVPYRHVDDIFNKITVEGGGKLTLADGLELLMGPDARLVVGDGTPGTLEAIAAQPNGIRIAGDGGITDWGTIGLFAQSVDSVLQNVEVAGGGDDSDQASIAIVEASPTIQDSFVHDSVGYAISWDCFSNPVLSGNTFADNALGDAVQNEGVACE